MGSASTKFRKHLQTGDEVQALHLYQNNTELRKALDPNCSYGDSYHHETPLHLASRHGMQMLMGIFLFSKLGNPNKANANQENCLHCLCQDSQWTSMHTHKRRTECLNYLLKWRGTKMADGTLEKIDLTAQDEKLNTALHYAAASGLSQCVETLVQQGAPLFVENEDNLTPCDTAEQNGHSDIALYLESKMVFSNDDEPLEEEDNVSMPPMEEYSGLRPQDLQEAKDMLLVETADMLSVPLFTAEALLRNHEWSRETLLEAWMTDPIACCETCGVIPPASLFSDKPQVQQDLASPLPSPMQSTPMSLDAECEICTTVFLVAEEPIHIACGHLFCKDCWESYLNVKIQEGDAHHITCPGFDCCMLVPVDLIEGVVSREMARRYLQFDIKAFVDSNPDIKWCPFPACGRAVKLPDLEFRRPHSTRSGGQRNRIPSDTSRGVDCGGGHYFCWECLEESHEPCSCPNWRSWFEKIAEVKPETLHNTDQETELAANCLWLVTNSKPCPNCKSPIQKNEGCNHMKCSKCKYDFCWVCLEQWKQHNSTTGGYFMCNRYEVVKKIEQHNAQIMTEAEKKNKKMQELNRFVHYYTRFKNHENSFKLEEPLLKTAKDKMMKLAEAVTDSATAQSETKFVEEAVQQLLKARRVLKCSYVYGYYLDGPGYKKIVFELMQTELEECTEILSQMVNRLYLRTPRRKIIDQAHVVQRKRHEFIIAISKGLVPPETPPSVRKKRRKKKKANQVIDEDLHRAIVESIKEVDLNNPWIKDATGKHTNVAALLDWPSDDSDRSDGETEVKGGKSSMGKCLRSECPKLRARNPRTQEAHDYCSRWCMLADRDSDHGNQQRVSSVVLDEHLELVRALDMSRLQYLREAGLIYDTDMEVSNNRPRTNSHGVRQRSGVGGGGVMDDFDAELQRFQELAGSCLKGEENGSKGNHCRSNRGLHSSRIGEDQSTVVTRVPNKSVEDLYCLEPGVKCHKQGHGAHNSASSPCLSRRASPGQARTSYSSIDQRPNSSHFFLSSSAAAPTFDLLNFTEDGSSGNGNQHDVIPNVGSTSAVTLSNESTKMSGGLFGAMFGAIKDLSVSNIHSNESDKTKDFSNKHLASMFANLDVEQDNGLQDSQFNDPPVEEFSDEDNNFVGVEGATCDNDFNSSWSSNSGKKMKSCEKRPAKNCDKCKRSKNCDTPCSSLCSSGDMNYPDCSTSNEELDKEISLLKMAENLVQMTADVHLRMKQVEKGIRDLDSRSKMECMKRSNGLGGCLRKSPHSLSGCYGEGEELACDDSGDNRNEKYDEHYGEGGKGNLNEETADDNNSYLFGSVANNVLRSQRNSDRVASGGVEEKDGVNDDVNSGQGMNIVEGRKGTSTFRPNNVKLTDCDMEKNFDLTNSTSLIKSDKNENDKNPSWVCQRSATRNNNDNDNIGCNCSSSTDGKELPCDKMYTKNTVYDICTNTNISDEFVNTNMGLHYGPTDVTLSPSQVYLSSMYDEFLQCDTPDNSNTTTTTFADFCEKLHDNDTCLATAVADRFDDGGVVSNIPGNRGVNTNDLDKGEIKSSSDGIGDAVDSDFNLGRNRTSTRMRQRADDEITAAQQDESDEFSESIYV